MFGPYVQARRLGEAYFVDAERMTARSGGWYLDGRIRRFITSTTVATDQGEVTYQVELNGAGKLRVGQATFGECEILLAGESLGVGAVSGGLGDWSMEVEVRRRLLRITGSGSVPRALRMVSYPATTLLAPRVWPWQRGHRSTAPYVQARPGLRCQPPWAVGSQ